MPFRRVEGEQAGPSALGILAPPGKRTLIIVRPRALDWDLLPLGPLGDRGVGPLFWEVSRDQAATMAERVFQSLEDWAGGGNGRVEAIAAPDGDGYQVRAAIGPFVLIVCQRAPGQPYRPLAFDSVAEAQAAVERLTPFLCPAADAVQEAYFNSRNFAR